MMRKCIVLACAATFSTVAMRTERDPARAKPKSAARGDPDGKTPKGKAAADGDPTGEKGKVGEPRPKRAASGNPAGKAEDASDEDAAGEEAVEGDKGAKRSEAEGDEGSKDKTDKGGKTKTDKGDKTSEGDKTDKSGKTKTDKGDKTSEGDKIDSITYAETKLVKTFLTTLPFGRFICGAATLLEVVEGNTKKSDEKVTEYMKDKDSKGLDTEKLSAKIKADREEYLKLKDHVKQIPDLGEEVDKIVADDMEKCTSALKAIGAVKVTRLGVEDVSLKDATRAASKGEKAAQVKLCKQIKTAYARVNATEGVAHPDGGRHTEEELRQEYPAADAEEFKNVDSEFRMVPPKDNSLPWWVWTLIVVVTVVVLGFIGVLVACMMMAGDQTKEIEDFEDDEAEETEGLDEE